VCKKDLLATGMILQAAALVVFVFAQTMFHYIFLGACLGIGTAMVYPTFLATVAENTHPMDRAKSLGTFRLWRDLGYAIGALSTGIIADFIGIGASIIFVAALTLVSGIIIIYRMNCSRNTVVNVAVAAEF